MLAIVPAVAVNVAELAPEATVTEAGTVRSGVLLARVMTAPLGGAACDKVTVQVEVAPLPRLVGAHANELKTAWGWAATVRATVVIFEVPL